MNGLTLFTTAFFVGFSGAMMPGPMLTVTITETPRRGFWVGPQLVFGHAIVECILIVCLAGGLSYAIQQPAVTGGIGLLGGIVLLWFGWSMYQGASNTGVSLNFSESGSASGIGRQSSVSPVISGIVLSLTNPYWSLWWATVGVSYVVAAISLGTLGLLLFFAGHILADLAWYSAVSFIVNTGRNYISDRLYQGTLVVCACFMVLLGCWFAIDGFQRLMAL